MGDRVAQYQISWQQFHELHRPDLPLSTYQRAHGQYQRQADNYGVTVRLLHPKNPRHVVAEYEPEV